VAASGIGRLSRPVTVPGVEGLKAMAQSAQTTDSGREIDIALVEISVVLVANWNDTSIINPDFLRHNGIVDSGLELKEAAISTPVLSQVVFEWGIGIRADPNRFVFEQKGEGINESGCLITGIASRFVRTVSHVPYSAIGINFTSFKPVEDDMNCNVSNALIDGGKWMSFKDTTPDVHLKAIYSYESRQITLDVRGVINTEGSDVMERHALWFNANIHRDIREIDQGHRNTRILSIINNWKGDVSDFKNLVDKFHCMEAPW